MRIKHLFIFIFLSVVPFLSLPGQDTTKTEKPCKIEKIDLDPVDNTLFVKMETKAHVIASFELFDILGQAVQTWKPCNLPPGVQRITLDMGNHHSGIYLFSMYVGDERMVFRIRKM